MSGYGRPGRPLSERNYQSTSKPKGQQKTGKTKRARFNKDQILQDYRIFTAQVSSAAPICDNDLTDPAPDRIQQIYLTILNAIQTESVDSFKQTALVAQSIDHPELFDDITYQLQFCRVMKRMMAATSIHDFGVMDLTFPDSKRTIRILGSLFNLLKFQTNVFEGDTTTTVIMDETDKLREHCGEMQVSNKAAKRKLKDLEKQRVEEQELEQELKEAIHGQQQETHVLHLQHEAAVKHYHAVMEAYEKAEQRQVKLDKELSQWTHRIEDLKMQIVSSPDKLKASLAQLEGQIQEAKRIKDETKGLLIKWESIVSNAHSVPPVIEGLNEDLERLADKVAKKSDLEAQQESSEENIGRLQQVIREANAKHQNLTRHLKLIEEEAAHALYDGQHKLPHLNHLESLQSDVDLLQQEMREKQKLDEELEKDIMKIRAKTNEVRQEVISDLKALESAVQKLQDALASHMKLYFTFAKHITGEDPTTGQHLRESLLLHSCSGPQT